MSQHTSAPALSIVVVSFNDPSRLERCLASLSDQAAAHNAEILVARAAHNDNPSLAMVRDRFPAVVWIDAPVRETIPKLRHRGLLAARGDIVGLLEDDCVIASGWCAAVLEAHRGATVAVGGAVEPGSYRSGRDWAVYFYEYGRFMLPFAAHRSSVLAGNNVTYRRADVLAAVSARGDGFYDVAVHDEWERAGREMQITPRLVVTNQNSWSASYVAIAPFHHGRGYAATRVQHSQLPERVARATMTLLLPAVQVIRLLRLTMTRKRLRARLFASLPWLALFSISWATGEFVGCLAGAGRSPEQWR